ncbi:hypothetical protein D5086_002641 [Populus alba]|uniref:Uncharacterized protein n=1 Tax=Populus alba TaxID=43335 RepID=A0ACC4D277_POPAL
MQKALRVYGQVLRLVRRLPKDSRPYYAKYARENFVNYRDVEVSDSQFLDELFLRAYNHSLWVLNKVFFLHASNACLMSIYVCYDRSKEIFFDGAIFCFYFLGNGTDLRDQFDGQGDTD